MATLAAPSWAWQQGMIIPAYFDSDKHWTKIGAAVPRVNMVAVMNPNSGPDVAARGDYVARIKAARAAGVRVVGYVRTNYGKRPIAEVRSEVEQYYKWYVVSGIFFDEVRNDDPGLPYYAKCRRLARASDAKALVVMNPGTTVTRGYMLVADIVVTFEHDYDAYVKRDADPDWVRLYPASRFWHLIYAVPDVKSMRNAVRLGKKRNVGWLYVTPDTLPNPWDTLPDEPYWAAELSALPAPAVP